MRGVTVQVLYGIQAKVAFKLLSNSTRFDGVHQSCKNRSDLLLNDSYDNSSPHVIANNSWIMYRSHCSRYKCLLPNEHLIVITNALLIGCSRRTVACNGYLKINNPSPSVLICLISLLYFCFRKYFIEVVISVAYRAY